mmetsp:Transcript_66152/g.193643  ORF Transcript_66152/g.193643 Transcript_66152/m.193643 type:complete len:236 (+) Transcript_66152:931-1638(+)
MDRGLVQLVAGLGIPQPDDGHVLAAALKLHSVMLPHLLGKARRSWTARAAALGNDLLDHLLVVRHLALQRLAALGRRRHLQQLRPRASEARDLELPYLLAREPRDLRSLGGRHAVRGPHGGVRGAALHDLVDDADGLAADGVDLVGDQHQFPGLGDANLREDALPGHAEGEGPGALHEAEAGFLRVRREHVIHQRDQTVPGAHVLAADGGDLVLRHRIQQVEQLGSGHIPCRLLL